MIDKQVVGGSSLPICEENVVCMIADDIFFQKILYISKICSNFAAKLEYYETISDISTVVMSCVCGCG